MTWDEKAEAEAKRKKGKDVKESYQHLFENTRHRPDGRMWRCERCKSTGSTQSSQAARWWPQ
eukprot:5638545-Pyramimonas_sp.AAC.1